MTKDGLYNPTKINKEYEKLLKTLNRQELSFIVDKLVWDKCILAKTIELIAMDIKERIES